MARGNAHNLNSYAILNWSLNKILSSFFLILVMIPFVLGTAEQARSAQNKNIKVSNSNMNKINQDKQSYLNIKTWNTASGSKVYFVPSNEIPIVDIDISFDAGSSRDKEKYGLADLTANMLTAGVKGLNEEQLIDKITSLGISISSDASRDMNSIEFRTMSMPQYLNPAIGLLAKIITTPTFPEDIYQRIKQQTITGIQLDKQSANAIAYKAFYNALYTNSPYAHPVDGTIETVKAITIQEIQKFYSQYYVAKNAIISIVGDITEAQARAISDRITQGLQVGTKATKLEKPLPPTKPQTIRIPFPSTQTTIIEGTLGIAKGAKLFFPLIVGNQILGGSGLTSLLFTKVRKEKGLAYGAYSTFSTLAVEGPFLIQVKTRNDKSKEAIKVINDTLNDFLKKGATQQELDASKKYLVGSFPLSFASNAGKLRILSTVAFYGLPLDYLDNYTKRISTINMEQVKLAFNDVFSKNAMITVIVGNDETVN